LRNGALAALAFLFLACASATPPIAAPSVTATVDQIVATPALDRAMWAIDIEDDDGTVVYQRNAHTLVIPASNRKLFASAAVANCLGLDHRFVTELWLDGRDLVLRGGGDPSLGGRYYARREQAFAPFVDALRARGITSIDGDLIADVSLFDRVTIPPSWKVGFLGESYAVPVDALAYDENVSTPAVTEAGVFAAEGLREALWIAGIRVRGVTRVNTTPRAWRERVATIESPPLFQLLTTVLKNSQNLYTDMLFKDLSANGTAPASFEASAAIERTFLTSEAGVDGREFHFVDGCGLAVDDFVTSSAVVKLLRWLDAPPRRGAFWDLFSTPSEQGTLHTRLGEFATTLRGKTGTLGGVNALSGIIAMPNGRRRYFSIVVNHHTASSAEANAAIDAIVRAVATPESTRAAASHP
jgi:D-alanyl-D-alanine carboxypeptidase/D-alanyl-D-alanine-endopeptidase (penicillin-binding protein 4)